MPKYINVDNNLNQTKKAGQSRRRRSGHSTLRIIMLTATLAVVSLILVVVSIYSSARISALNQNKHQLEYALKKTQNQLETLKPEMEEVKASLNELVNSRIPGLYKLEVNKVMDVQSEQIKNIVFTLLKRSGKIYYKYLLVVENNSVKKLSPSFKVLLFNRNGIHIATHKVEDGTVLTVGESRDYTSEIEFLFEAEPRYFYIDNLTLTAG